MTLRYKCMHVERDKYYSIGIDEETGDELK